jgi:hypothetical protein
VARADAEEDALGGVAEEDVRGPAEDDGRGGVAEEDVRGPAALGEVAEEDVRGPAVAAAEDSEPRAPTWAEGDGAAPRAFPDGAVFS